MRLVKNGDVHVSAPIGTPRKVVEAFIAEHRQWMEKASEKNAGRQEQRAAFFARLPLETKAQREDAEKRIRALLEPMIERYAKLMGVAPSSVSYKPMISRWGVCNVKTRSITYSTYLLLLPQWCAEHVVVHELCHLLEPSHNARFHRLMDFYFPVWRQARKESKFWE